jgi:hypothetical protein
MLAQVQTRRTDSWSLQGTRIILPVPRRLFLLHVVICDMAFTVEISQSGTLCGIGHHNEMPSLEIGTCRRLEGDLDASLDHCCIHWSRQIEAFAYGASGSQ